MNKDNLKHFNFLYAPSNNANKIANPQQHQEYQRLRAEEDRKKTEKHDNELKRKVNEIQKFI